MFTSGSKIAKAGKRTLKVAIALSVALILQQVAWISGSTAAISYEGQALGALPTITFEGDAIYDGMKMPECARLMVGYEFIVYPGQSFHNVQVVLPEPLIAAQPGAVDVLIRNNAGVRVAGGLYVGGDGDIRFNLDLASDIPLPDLEAEQEIARQPDYISEAENAEQDERTQEQGEHPEQGEGLDGQSEPSDPAENHHLVGPPNGVLPLMFVSNFSEPAMLEPYTVSFEIPAVFDLDKIPGAESDAPIRVTLVSGGEPVTVYLAAAINALVGIMPLSFNLPAWNSTAPFDDYRFFPLGLVHDFGALVFTDLEVKLNPGVWGGFFHSEGGVMVGRDINMFGRTTLDFGMAHKGVGEQTNPIDGLRLILGRNFTADYGSGLAPPSAGSLPHEAVVYLHQGGLIVRDSVVFTSRGYIEVDPGNPSPSPILHGVPPAPGGYYYTGWLIGGSMYGGSQPIAPVPTATDAEMLDFFNHAWGHMTGLSDHFRDLVTDTTSANTAVNPHVYLVNAIDVQGQSVPRIQPPDGADPNSTIVYQLLHTGSYVVSENGVSYTYDSFVFPELYFRSGFNGNFIINVHSRGPHNPVSFPADTAIRGPDGSSIYDNSNIMEIYQKVREYSGRIIWNFLGDAPIVVDSDLIIGGVLAPRAHFRAKAGGSVNGELVVGALSHAGGGFEQHTTSRLQLGLPGAPWPVVPPPTTPPPPPTDPLIPIIPIPPPPPTLPPEPPLPPPIPPQPPTPGPGDPGDPGRPPPRPNPPPPPSEPPLEEYEYLDDDLPLGAYNHNPVMGGFRLGGNASLVGFSSSILIVSAAFVIIRRTLRRRLF